MTNRAGLSPIIGILAMLLAPGLALAAEEPAATAVIPPPAPAVAVHKAEPSQTVHKPSPPATAHQPSQAAAKATAGSPAKPRHATAEKKKNTHTAAAARVSPRRKPDLVAQRNVRHRATERRSVIVHAPPPVGMPRAYAGGPMLGPDGPPPPLPPPWYDRARPAIAFAYPPPFMGPRGPMPWWVR